MVTHLNIIYQNPLSEHILLHHSHWEFQQTKIDDDDAHDDDDDDDHVDFCVEINWRRRKRQADQMKQTCHELIFSYTSSSTLYPRQ